MTNRHTHTFILFWPLLLLLALAAPTTGLANEKEYRTPAERAAALSAEDREIIQEWVYIIGDPGQDRALRRKATVGKLARQGAVVLPFLESVLADPQHSWIQRKNAAKVVARLAAGELPLRDFRQIVPKLIDSLSATHRWVRVSANRALERISGQDMGYRTPTGNRITYGERQARQDWQRWWADARERLPQGD